MSQPFFSGNGNIVSKSILLSEGESKPRLLRSFAEFKPGDLNVTDCEFIVGDKPFHRTGTIMDLKGGAILLVTRRGGRIILVMKETSNGCALFARNPQVARTGAS